MCGTVGADISTVSKHLSVLKNAGIIADTKRGTQAFYSLSFSCMVNSFARVESVLKASAMAQAALVR